MSPVEWYYVQDNKRQGPVSAMELKALADAGKLRPDDLVLREGMDGGVPARRVKGLFDTESPTPSSPGAPVSESSEAGPMVVEPQAVPVAPEMPFPGGVGIPENRVRGFEKSLTAFQRAREGSAVHLFDVILNMMRNAFPATLVEATCQTFSLVGYYTLYGAMLLVLVVTSLQSLDAKQFSFFGWGLAGVIGLVVLQYTASRFLPALDRLNQSSPGRVCSTAFLDCLALLLLGLGVAAVLGLVVYAVQESEYLMILLAVELFIAAELAAFVAVGPETVSITVSQETRAGEEALGVWTFLLKLILKLAPVLFGLGVLHGTAELLYALVLLAGRKGVVSLFIGRGLVVLLCAAAIPMIIYILFLSSYLMIDLMRALLGLPRLLTQTLNRAEEPPEEG